MTVEIWFRWISGVALLAAALFTTAGAVRWSHPVARPAFRFAAPVLWLSAVYRIGLAASAFPTGTEWGELIRLWVSVEFFLWAISSILFALATREFHRRGIELRANGNGT